MGKLLLWCSLIALLIIGVGTYVAANNPMFWLASAAHSYQYLRIAAGAIIILQLMTAPPRHVVFRIIAGVFAVVLGGWAIHQTYDYHMALLDSAAFVGSSLAIVATALERNVMDEFHTSFRRRQQKKSFYLV